MYMFKYICKRIGLMLMTFTIIFTVCFVLIKLLPIDTSTVGIGEDKAKLEALMEARGYNKPIPEMTADGLHPTDDTFERFADILEPIIRRLINA